MADTDDEPGKTRAREDADEQGFLQRWSRRKAAARLGAAEPEALGAGHDTVALAQPSGTDVPAALDRTPDGQPAPTDAQREEEDFAAIDFDALDFSSDYSRFMGADVPDAVRTKALARLWVSDPIFSRTDGLDIHVGDYTDAATVPAGLLQSAWKVGQGFLSDEEAAAQAKIGKPAEPDAPMLAEASSPADVPVDTKEPPLETAASATEGAQEKPAPDAQADDKMA